MTRNVWRHGGAFCQHRTRSSTSSSASSKCRLEAPASKTAHVLDHAARAEGGGQTKAEIKSALQEYEELQAAAECRALGDISTDSEAGEEEDEGDEGEVAGGEQAAAAVVGGGVDDGVEDGVEEDDDDDSDDDAGTAARGYGLVTE